MIRPFPLRLALLAGTACACAALTLPSATAAETANGQPTAARDDEAPAIEPWVRELSAIDANRRAKYISLIMLAKRSFQQEQWTECLSCLNSAEAIFKGNPNVLNLRGACHTELACYDDAARELADALRLMPGDPATMMNLTTLDMKQGNWKECAERIRTMLANLPAGTGPELADILRFRRYVALLRLGATEEARQLAALADPLADSPYYYCTQAAAAYAKGDADAGNQNMAIATRIFRNTPVLRPYQKALIDAGLIHPLGGA